MSKRREPQLIAHHSLAVSPRRIAVAALIALGALSLFFPTSLRAQEPSGPAVAAALENLLVDSIARAEKSVVAIVRVDADEQNPVPEGFGAGRFERAAPSRSEKKPGDPDFIPDEYGTGVVVGEKGLILTYYHVLGLKSRHYITTFERKTYPARIKAADPRSDLAVLEIEASNLIPIPLGDGAALKKGQIVVALGNPYAIARDGQASASWGIIANLGRKVGLRRDPEQDRPIDRLYHHGMLIQTDAKLNLGTSGGALLNLKGKMIGLTTSLAATAGYEQAAGYAVPVDETFRRIVETLKEGREVEYGFLGVQPENLRPFEILQGLHGVRILERPEPGTPADRFGLKQGDIVTHVNGQPIFDTDGLMLQVGKLPVETVVKLSVERDDRKLPLEVELSKFPVRGQIVATQQPASWRGLRVDYATFSLALASDAFHPIPGRPDPDGCVVIREVEKDSPAAAAQLQVGMFISRVGDTQVRSPREFRKAVAGQTGEVPLHLSTGGDQPEVRTVKPPAG